jgi:hypothetical protein
VSGYFATYLIFRFRSKVFDVVQAVEHPRARDSMQMRELPPGSYNLVGRNR